jgi:ketosteroid isomerase-like protein
MPSTSVELVQSLFAAWSRGDYSSFAWAHPEIEFTVADGPSPGTWTGVAGMVKGYGEVMNAWEDYGGDAEGYEELDDGRVLALIRLSGRGKVSGMDLGNMQPKGSAGIFEVRDGTVTRITLYWERDRALADLDLAREPNGGA